MNVINHNIFRIVTVHMFAPGGMIKLSIFGITE